MTRRWEVLVDAYAATQGAGYRDVIAQGIRDGVVNGELPPPQTVEDVALAWTIAEIVLEALERRGNLKDAYMKRH